MSRHHSRELAAMRAVTGVVLVLGVLALHDSANAEANLSVEMTAGYTNNLLRRPEGLAEVPASLGLTGTWTETTRHLAAAVEGRVDGIKYLKDTYGSERNVVDDEVGV
mgnify:CR=1 FL=1